MTPFHIVCTHITEPLLGLLSHKLAHMQLNFPIVIHQKDKSLKDNLLTAINSLTFLQQQFGVIYGKGQVTTLQTCRLFGRFSCRCRNFMKATRRPKPHQNSCQHYCHLNFPLRGIQPHMRDLALDSVSSSSGSSPAGELRCVLGQVTLH